MGQSAYGAQYKYVFGGQFFRNIIFGGYYANTPNKTLDPIVFLANDTLAYNDRNIAGGISNGLDIGTDFLITNKTLVSTTVNYDDIRYKTIYTPDSSDDGKGIGGTLGVNQLVSDRLKLSLEGSLREIYDSYRVGISWLPPFLKKIGFLDFGKNKTQK